MVLQGSTQPADSSSTEGPGLPEDELLAVAMCNEIRRREVYLEVPDHLNGPFDKLERTAQSTWLFFASSIPLKLSSLGLCIRKCKGPYRTCIITEEEIDKLARFDHRNSMESNSRINTAMASYENLTDEIRSFFKELNYLIPLLLKEYAYELFRPGEGKGIEESMITRLARAIHSMYMAEIRRTSGDKKGVDLPMDWEMLSDEVRASNLDSARHIHTKLLAIGYRIETGKEGFRSASLVLNDEEIETMAKIEHLRWCWEKRVNGWVRGRETDAKLKVHASLIPYAWLSENDKRKDREVVKLIPALLQDLNYEAIPLGGDRINSLPYAIRPESTVHHLLRMTRELNEQIEELNLDSDLIKISLGKLIRPIEKAAYDLSCSYDYARHIQEAFMPEDLRVKESFPESFILYKPRDIVSGDFYYFNTQGALSIFAAADCTGHGIPGALLSTIGYGYIDQAVGELGIYSPSLILQHLYSRIHRFLRRNEEGNYLFDDLDIALCAYDHQSRLLRFSAVRIPLFHKTTASGKLMKYKTMNQYEPAGDCKVVYYEEVEIPLDFGDVIYMGSDGFADQFGGNPRKKYGTSRLRSLLQEISTLSMPRQKEIMEQALENWKEEGKEEQTDDILMMGIRI